MSVGVVDKTTGDRIPTAGNPLDKVGNLANLTTTAKDNAVNAINEVNATKANQTQLATVEASTTASKAYNANEYLVLGGVLYKVTANIAQGGTIVTEGAGKNVDLATVGGELNAINSNLTTKVGYRSYYSQAETTEYSIPITRAAAYIIAVNIPTGANTANPGLYYVIKQGSSVTKSDLITDVLGLAVSISDSNLVLSWTVSNFYGANIIVIPVYEFT